MTWAEARFTWWLQFLQVELTAEETGVLRAGVASALWGGPVWRPDNMTDTHTHTLVIVRKPTEFHLQDYWFSFFSSWTSSLRGSSPLPLPLCRPLLLLLPLKHLINHFSSAVRARVCVRHWLAGLGNTWSRSMSRDFMLVAHRPLLSCMENLNAPWWLCLRMFSAALWDWNTWLKLWKEAERERNVVTGVHTQTLLQPRFISALKPNLLSLEYFPPEAQKDSLLVCFARPDHSVPECAWTRAQTQRETKRHDGGFTWLVLCG